MPVADQPGILDHSLALGKALRPFQWIKNTLVFLPLLFAVRVVWSPQNLAPLPDLLVNLGLAFLGFCAVSSAVYLVNDVSDRDADRNHPLKRNRPLASGAISVPAAIAVALLLAGSGLAALAAINLVVLWVALAYLGINLAYSLGAKHVALVDVFLVSAGYVIRVVAGAVAIGAPPSPWLYATTAAGALFIVLGRRYAEVRLAGGEASAQRPVLALYSGPLIGQLLTISATAAWLSYTLYTVEAANLPTNNTMLLTVPLVTLGLFRYLYLLNTDAYAETPERLISKDPPMVFAIFSWMVASSIILWFGS